MVDLLANVGLVTTALLGATTKTLTVITDTPILMVGVVLSITFAGITLFHKIRG